MDTSTIFTELEDVYGLSTAFEKNDALQGAEICQQFKDVTYILINIICAIGIVFNVFSIVCLRKDRSETSTPMLLISLEAGDTILLAASIVVYGIIKDPNDAPLIFKMAVFVGFSGKTASIYFTLLVTINRYVGVTFPLKSRIICSVHRSIIQIIFIWIFSIAFSLPRFFQYDIVKETVDNETVKYLGMSELSKSWEFKYVYFTVSRTIVMYILPLVPLVFFNIKLIIALRKSSKKRKELSKNAKSENDVTLTLIVVVLVFFICQTPTVIVDINNMYISPDIFYMCPDTYAYVEALGDLLVIINSAVNFIIYCACGKRFRNIVVTTLKGWLRFFCCASTEQEASGFESSTQTTKYQSHNISNRSEGSKISQEFHSNKMSTSVASVTNVSFNNGDVQKFPTDRTKPDKICTSEPSQSSTANIADADVTYM